MEQERLFNTLKKIVIPYLPEDIPEKEIGMDSHFVKELNINSAHLVDIILDVEDEFDITLNNEDMEAMQSVGEAMALIAAKLKNR